MTSDPSFLTQLIWATRGRSWGFRFLLDAGLDDPLPEYERAFRDVAQAPASWAHAGQAAAVRIPDPEGRRDSAGRVIPHEFVAFGPLGESVTSTEDGLRYLWPLVEGAFQRVWDTEEPPLSGELIFD